MASPLARRWPALLLLAVVLPTAGWVFYESQRMFRADVVSVAARRQISLWVSGVAAPRSQGAWDEAYADLSRAIEITPDNPALYEDMADLFVVAGQRDWADEARRRPHFEQAVAQYKKAIALRPRDAKTWAGLALAYGALGERGLPLQEAWNRALALGPNEGHVQPVLMQVVLEVWDDATPPMQQWAKQIFEKGDAGTRASINQMAKSYGLRFVPDELQRK